MNPVSRRRGLSLLELLVVSAILATTSVSILGAMTQARLTRARAESRAALAVAAQGALEEARCSPEAYGTTSTQVLQLRGAPDAVITTTWSRFDEGSMTLEVEAMLPSDPEGVKPVRLVTLVSANRRPGGAQR